jgi:hypothetical protein
MQTASSLYPISRSASPTHNPTIKSNIKQEYKTDVARSYSKAASLLGENEN